MEYESGKIFKGSVVEALYSMIRGLGFIQQTLTSHPVDLNRRLAIKIWYSC